MRISAPSRSDAGFTLVELLIVLVVMGLLASVVVVAMPDPKGSVMAEAQRFAARAKAAQDKAILDGRAVAVRVSADGYSFEQRRDGAWQPMAPPYSTFEWHDRTAAAMTAPGRFLFDATGIAEPASLTLTRDGERARVEIDGGGAVRVGA
ncbi:GspH/FimT family pseudopilin [Allosphingosinicella flava]|uniref:Type II secretion system protein H n=1 Tax=Allosphingosinicella flava TaxID=2771430 RepID=A0A7T2LL34_9SPHN|nr:GspH/FimT family pseudopilin [Sphingosinicella flava]QPQ53994.1 GspH/FimT family pseudopilin [Sphingosinicella flava]